ncbi:MAG: phosphotriesterase-related protein [Chloroflexi bacterium HGW-Chloroflexi-10]|nr:MAG: phosphotriesterase-related protein [Chloroflexi bacterium HGW-Chloroflexi-10]
MKIRTVLGDIPPETLGVTSCHEHLLWSVPEPYQDEDPDLGFDSIPASVAELRYFKAAGGNALIEMTTKEIGRAALDLCQISAAANVHIIAATGHHKHKFSAGLLQEQTTDQIVSTIFNDLHEGMDGTPVCAGVIKAATSLNAASPIEQKVIQAVGIAHQKSGAPVSTHTEAGSFAIEQVGLLLKHGVAAEKLLIGHLDRNLTWETYISLAQKGVYLGFDQIGKEKYWPDAERIQLIHKLIQTGYTSQILLSCDSARKSTWHTHNPQVNGPAYLFMDFIPALCRSGIGEADIETILIQNPARFLAF